MRMSDIEICQHAVRKRTASETGPSRPPKRRQASAQAQAATPTPAPVAASLPTEGPDALPASAFELILALSAPTVLPIVPSKDRAARKIIEEPLVFSSTEKVQVEVREPEQSAAASVAPLVGAQSSSSFPSLSNMGSSRGDQGKTPMTLAEDAASEGRTIFFNFQVPGDESTLANSMLARRLC